MLQAIAAEGRQFVHAACLFRYRVASAAERGDLTLEEVVATSDGGPAAKIGLLLADHEKTLQDLVSQIVTHWKVPLYHKP